MDNLLRSLDVDNHTIFQFQHHLVLALEFFSSFLASAKLLEMAAASSQSSCLDGFRP